MQHELVERIISGSAYLRSCGNDAVAHSVYMALFEIARVAANCDSRHIVEKMSTRYNRAFDVFELPLNQDVKRMFLGANYLD